MTTIEIRDLRKRFGEVQALDGMSFTVRDGEIYGFVGSNGAGKSTTMRIALGVLAADSGEVLLDGRPLDDDTRRRIGYMPEERGLYGKEKILDQLVFLAKLHGVDGASAKQRGTELLETLGLGERLNDKLDDLSLGNQQRVQLAASLIHDPDVLILDEPFSGLDPVAVDVMSTMLTDRARQGVPVIFSSHQLDLVQRLCDRVGIVTRGHMVAEGTVAELRDQGPIRYRVGTTARGWLPEGVALVPRLRGPRCPRGPKRRRRPTHPAIRHGGRPRPRIHPGRARPGRAVQGGRALMTPQRAYSPMHTITTTAAREVQILLVKKGVIATLAIMLLAVVGLIGFGTWQKNKEDTPEATSVATVGVDTQLLSGSGYEPRAAADRDEAVRMVRDGDVDAALVADGDQWQVISDGTPSVSVMSGMESLAESYTRSETLATLGISPEDYAAASRTIDVVPVDVDDATGGEDTEQHFARLLTTFAALMMVIFTVITFAAQVGSRVTEEKSSRVVELVLATVRPLDFLAGKLLGTLILGFIATALLLAVGGVGLKVSGLVDDVELDWSVFPVLLLAWLLSMLFFGALYAAAGAMVQRTEDLQSTQMPILVLIMASAYIPAFGWMSTSSTWMQVMSWIPPFSIFAAPLSYAAGDFTALQLAGSFGIATLATVLAVWAAARIYKRTILNNGSVTKWSQVLRKA